MAMGIDRGNWKIEVRELPWSMKVEIYLIDKDYKPSLAHYKNGQIELTEIIEGLEQEPTFTLPVSLWEAMKYQMIDNKVREKNEVEAELGATKYHLEDMRKLLKLN
jgi:hypothetical protein